MSDDSADRALEAAEQIAGKLRLRGISTFVIGAAAMAAHGYA